MCVFTVITQHKATVLGDLVMDIWELARGQEAGSWAGLVPSWRQHLSTVLTALFLALAPSQGLGEGLKEAHWLLEAPGALLRGVVSLETHPLRCCQGHLPGLCS